MICEGECERLNVAQEGVGADTRWRVEGKADEAD